MSERPAPPRIAGFDYVRPLGSGGFAEVYLYDQDMPRRRVAVKVLSAPLDAARERSAFETEVDAMARLSAHPSIVSVFQAGLAPDGRPYLVMEFCPESMKQYTRSGPARLQLVLDAGVRLASALETAHRAHVLHRDIKPSNVLISVLGRPMLTDFGISSWHGRDASGGTTRAMSIPWAAPEMVTGATFGTVATEVWSLAATLYTFAAGHSPFEGADAEQNTSARMRRRIAKAHYTPVPGASGYEAFDAVMARAMSPKPEDRFARMRDFAEALQGLQRHYGYGITDIDLAFVDWTSPDPAPTGSADSGGDPGPDAAADWVGASSGAAHPPPRLPAPAQTDRARARAALLADRSGSADRGRDRARGGRKVSLLTAGLIGAGSAIAGVIALAAVAKALGWF